MTKEIMPPRKKLTEAPVKTKIIESDQFDEGRYETNDRYVKGKEPRTIAEIAAYLKENDNAKVDALLLCGSKRGGFKATRIQENDAFVKAFEHGGAGVKLRETDYFGTDTSPSSGDTVNGGGGSATGDDYVPLLGGPFSKQLYMYDALRMFALAFQAYHHDPIARAIVHITRDFTLGRGFRVDSQNKAALAYWRAFEEANNLQQWFNTAAAELSINGELMVWWLPGNQIYNSYKPKVGDKVPTGIIPRIKLIDPSTCWEIITYPEDISRVISYRLVYPTQYQIYTTPEAPSSKFIIQDIPADQVQHHKINCVSNEKRGRSDLFPAFSYLKRLRDSVNYSVIAMQKSVAWSIDTTIEGSQSDIDGYVQAQQAAGTIAPAGSEFVHTSKIKREYLSNSASKGGTSTAFDWCLNMIAAAVQIPVNYFGIQSHGGSSSRASALVATEPVAKKFENRQQDYERILKAMWTKLMKTANIEDECEITFPEVIVQDRSQKIKDIKIAEDCGYISKERAATMASKELSITEFEYDDEKAQIVAEGADGPILPNMIAPLTAPAAAPPKGGTPAKAPAKVAGTSSPTAVTSQDKKAINDKR